MAHVQSTVPQDQQFLLRNAPLPTSDSVFPSDLASSALEKHCAAVQDAALQQAIAPKKAPRGPLKKRSPAVQEAGPSGVQVGASGSPVVPPGTSRQGSGPPPPPRKKKRRPKSDGPFPDGSNLPAQGGAGGKGRRRK